MMEPTPTSIPSSIQSSDLWDRAPYWRFLIYLGAFLSALWIVLLNFDPKEPIELKDRHFKSPGYVVSDERQGSSISSPVPNTINTTQTFTPTNQLIKNTDDSVEKSQPLAPAMPDAKESPVFVGNSTDMFSWIGGISQDLKNNCQSSLNRHPGGSVEPGTSYIRLQAEGIWCFFDSTTQLYEIRMDTPFSGSVSGIHIGDPSDRLRLLGAPYKQIALIPSKPESLFYKLGSGFTLRIERSNDDY